MSASASRIKSLVDTAVQFCTPATHITASVGGDNLLGTLNISTLLTHPPAIPAPGLDQDFSPLFMVHVQAAIANGPITFKLFAADGTYTVPLGIGGLTASGEAALEADMQVVFAAAPAFNRNNASLQLKWASASGTLDGYVTAFIGATQPPGRTA